MITQKFDIVKAINALLFTTKHITNFYIALKVFYFADQKHLEEYGRLITSDTYVKMRKGPVPSEIYDLVKFLRGDGFFQYPDWVKGYFKVTSTQIIPLKELDMNYLSESDIECLQDSIDFLSDKSYSEVKDLSHDEVFNNAKGRMITIFDMAAFAKDSSLLIDHLRD